MGQRDRQDAQDGKASNEDDIIIAEGVTVGYGDHIILEDISFRIARGSIVAILGPSGCGKTTLFKALTGLLRPRSGKIEIAGIEVDWERESESIEDLRRRIGVLFQSGALIASMSIHDNIALPIERFSQLPPPLLESLVRLKLDVVDLGEHGEKMPAELSGGMKKRASLARAMALDPAILFCDEPSSGLDPESARKIDALLVEMSQDLETTILVITHELASIDNVADRCLMLDGEAKGIIARGTPDELRQSDDDRVRSFFSRRIEEEFSA